MTNRVSFLPIQQTADIDIHSDYALGSLYLDPYPDGNEVINCAA